MFAAQRLLEEDFLAHPITKFTPLFVHYEKVMEALRKCFGFHFHLFFSSLSPILSEICIPKVFENFTEAPETIFQQNDEELATQLLPP